MHKDQSDTLGLYTAPVKKATCRCTSRGCPSSAARVPSKMTKVSAESASVPNWSMKLCKLESMSLARASLGNL